MHLHIALLALCGAALSMSIPTAPTPQGYIVAGQFNCVEFNCADLELDLSRLSADPTMPKNATGFLLKSLIPSTAFGSMNQDLYSAFDNSSRTYYLLATTPGSGAGIFWGFKISNDVSSAQKLFSNKFQFPEANGDVIGMHCTLNGTIILVFGRGAVAFVDPVKGTLSPLGSLLPSQYTNGFVTTATAYDAATDRVFGFITNEFNSDWALSTLAKGVATAQKLTFKPRSEKEGAEIVMNAIYSPDTRKVVLTLQAVSDNLGFDQVWQFDPTTGDGTYVFFNLMEELGAGAGFDCVPAIKDCDSKQTIAYDVARGRLYFQGRLYESSDDDTGNAALFYTDMTGRFYYLYNPIGLYFGFQAFQYVPIVA